jgi:hypothetical protein
LPSLAGEVAGTKTQLRGLEAVTTALAARIATPFLAVQKHIEATGKQMERLHRLGRNMSLGVTMPVGFGAVSMLRNAVERDKAGNNLEALGGVSPAERRVVEDYADTIASKYGNATGILKTFNSLLKAGFSVPAAKGSIASILEGSIVADGEMSSDELATLFPRS